MTTNKDSLREDIRQEIIKIIDDKRSRYLVSVAISEYVETLLTSHIEEADEKYSSILKCPCDHETHKGEPHTQEETGCPNCDIAHDESYWFSNAEVKYLITKHEVEARKQGQIMSLNYIKMKSQIFTYARKVGEIEAGEEAGAVPISEINNRLESLQKGIEQ